jgi:hypothetical protein
MNFANLKKQSKDFGNLLKEVDKLANPTYEKDETADLYWKPTPDKTGNALAVIRFLPGPAVDGEDALPWVQYWDHGFQNKATGKWYIEKSLTTLNQKDPVSELNSQLWNSSQDDNGPERKQARDQKRRLHYVSNILVINDPQNKDAEGKVFLYKYGKKIFDKITKMMNPDLESEKAVNPFDLWNGANFKLKVTRQNVNMGGRNVSFPNYDESVFLTPGPLSEEDGELEKVWKAEHSLKEIVDLKNFKSYEELKKRLEDVMGYGVTPAPAPKAAPIVEEEPIDMEGNITYSKKATMPPKHKPVVEEEEDEDLAMFRKLAED